MARKPTAKSNHSTAKRVAGPVCLAAIFDPAPRLEDLAQACQAEGLKLERKPNCPAAAQANSGAFLTWLVDQGHSTTAGQSITAIVPDHPEGGLAMALIGHWPATTPGQLQRVLTNLCLHLAGEQSQEPPVGETPRHGRWSLWAELLKRRVLPFQNFRPLHRQGAVVGGEQGQLGSTRQTSANSGVGVAHHSFDHADLVSMQRVADHLQVELIHLIGFAIFHALQARGQDWQAQVPLRMLWFSDRAAELMLPWPALDLELHGARGPAAMRAFASQLRQLELQNQTGTVAGKSSLVRWGLSGTYSVSWGQSDALEPLLEDVAIVGPVDRQLPLSFGWWQGEGFGNLTLGFDTQLLTQSDADALLAEVSEQVQAIMERSDSSGRTWDVEALKKRWPPLSEPFRSLPFGKNVIPEAKPIQALLPEANKPPQLRRPTHRA